LKTYENIAKNQYGMELEQVLASSGQTLDSFKQQLAENEVKPSMDSQMKIYAIFDKEKLSLDKSEIDNRIKDTVNEIDVLSLRGVVPTFISCKNGTVNQMALYELETVAERFGGKYAKKVIAAPQGLNETHALRAKEMKIEIR
jgi:hypothetical protein